METDKSNATIYELSSEQLLELAHLQIQCIKYSRLEPEFLATTIIHSLPQEFIPPKDMAHIDRLIQCRDIFDQLIFLS